MSRARLAFINQAIAHGGVLSVDGGAVVTALQDGLISDDDKVIYRIDDGIPVLLPEAGIGTTQWQDLPK